MWFNRIRSVNYLKSQRDQRLVNPIFSSFSSSSSSFSSFFFVRFRFLRERFLRRLFAGDGEWGLTKEEEGVRGGKETGRKRERKRRKKDRIDTKRRGSRETDTGMASYGIRRY